MAENVIELNGKRYDAVTGAYLGVSHTFAEPAAAPPVSRGRVIDGFIRPTPVNTQHAKTAKPHTPAHVASVHHKTTPKPEVPAHATAKQNKPHVPAHAKSNRQNHTPALARPHQPERAKTLMRRAVRKPELSKKPAIKVQAPAEVSARPLSTIVPKRSALQVDPHRLERAKSVVRHSHIRHFMPARPEYSQSHTPARAAAEHVARIPVKPTPAAPVKRQQHSDIFEAAMARAESHKQPAHKRSHRSHHRRLVNISAGLTAFLLIAGFVTYLNLPNIQLQVASVKAGFKAEMPSYKPTGYAMKGGVQRIGNTVSLQFRSGENDFTLTQQPSSWNSQTLVENTLALSNGAYRTVEAAGRTVYIYNDNDAVWVNGGVRYDLNSNAKLSTGEISRLAASL